MDLNWTFGKRLGAGFALAGIALLLVATAGYWSIHSLVENDRWVTHTYQTRIALANLVSSLKDAETGQRGFVITGNESFLEPYQAALVSVDKVFDYVRRLTADN